MAQHFEISPDESEIAVRIAQRALRVANGLSTARPGSMFIPNKDENGFNDGTGTWIGSGGIGDGGVMPWVGDTTPPGKPTGVSCSSAWGTIYCKWDGTLDGGVPSDFAYVTVSIDGEVVGNMTEAGTIAADGYSDGASVKVGFTAYDSARDMTGGLSPNASGTAYVDVSVVNEKDSIDKKIQDAEDKANDLAGKVSDVETSVNGVKQDVSELSTKVEGAASDADAALTAATEAKQTAESISTKAEQAYEDAQSALTKASNAEQTANSIKTTVEEDYLSKDEASGSYASKSDLEQTASSIKTEVGETYVSKDDASSTYATKTELSQTSESFSTKVSEAVTTANGAMEKATTLEQTVDGFEARVTEASDKADEAINAAGSVNLIENSSFELGTTNWVADSGTMTVEDDSDYIHHLKVIVTGGSKRIYSNTTNVWVSGRTYSYSFYIKASSSGSTVTPSRSIIDIGQTHAVTTSWQRITGTIVSTDTVDAGTLSLVFSSTSVTYYIARVKLEVGESATPWSSSPIDFGEASKTATNYLGFSSSGLVVGTNSSGTGQSGLQGNVRLTSGGMEVRSGSTVLASYGANEIDLGKNSQSTIINLCNGAGVISGSGGALSLTNGSVVGQGTFIQMSKGNMDIYSYYSSSANGEIRLGNGLQLIWNGSPLGGNVFKQLWSGTFSGGSINVPGLQNYNLIAAATGAGTTSASPGEKLALLARYNGKFSGIGGSTSGTDIRISTFMFNVSGTTLSYGNGGRMLAAPANDMYSNRPIYRIYGIL